MATITLSPSARLKTKDAVNRLKHGSPRLKETLRKRCRERIKEQRHKFIDTYRKGFQSEYENVQNTLAEILREEFDHLSATGELHNLLLEDAPVFDLDVELMTEEELLDEEEKWLSEEYERMLLEEEVSYLTDMKENLTCPLCMKSSVIKDPNVTDRISCKTCKFELSTSYTIKEIETLVQKTVESHSLACNGVPNFTLCTEDDRVYLCLICDICLDIIPIE